MPWGHFRHRSSANWASIFHPATPGGWHAESGCRLGIRSGHQLNASQHVNAQEEHALAEFGVMPGQVRQLAAGNPQHRQLADRHPGVYAHYRLGSTRVNTSPPGLFWGQHC